MKINKEEKRIYLNEVPKRFKKITGTRFASILGFNKYNNAFKSWCEILKVYEEEFKDSIYTISGKIVEDFQINYLKDFYKLDGVKKPEDLYGIDFFNKTHGDFFKDNKIFGGMWDAITTDEAKNVSGVIECKTTKNATEWLNDVPIYYGLQASLYAYLLGVDTVYMIVTFLDDETYNKVEYLRALYGDLELNNRIKNGLIKQDFNISLNIDNTKVYKFNYKEKYKEFFNYIDMATEFYNKHLLGGISPIYDEIKDKDILDKLTKTSVVIDENGNNSILELMEKLESELEIAREAIKDKEKLYNNLKKQITEELSEILNADTNLNKVDISGKRYKYTLSRVEVEKIDKEKLKLDGLFDIYGYKEAGYRLTKKEI